MDIFRKNNIIIKNKKSIHFLVFTLLFCSISYYISIFQSVSYPPQSIHAWRQADGASFALNYYQNGMNFFKPELQNLHADNNQSGYATSECPLLYYFVAILYKIFGYHEAIFRIVNFLIFFIGLYYSSLLALKITRQHLISIFIPIIVLTFPSIAYYSNSYLTDSTAFAIIMSGWYYAWLSFENPSKRNIILCLLLFAIAILLKITTAINLIALLLIWGYLFLNNFNLKPNIIAKIVCSVSVITLCVSWYLFVFWYNNHHSTDYFANHTSPIWKYTKENIIGLLKYIHQGWAGNLIQKNLDTRFLLMLIISLPFYKKIPKTLNLVNLLLFLGSASYFILWFGQFKDHDYYFFTILPLIIFLLISFYYLIRIYIKNRYGYIFILIVSVSFLGINSIHARKSVRWIYCKEHYSNTINPNIFEMRNKLDSLQIEPGAKIICMPDFSFAHSLYLLNRKGWTNVFNRNTDSLSVKQRISDGADYLIITDTTILRQDFLKPYIKKEKCRFRNILVFSLQ